ncbi:hypothetical protein LCGC14_1638760 [marine sediment metagenome]|uniref:NERD domain-containing protein n=1 Tax=marine sediment metagenome TaxID=412755 RepID=A0A0F9KZU0_9ZZZZ
MIKYFEELQRDPDFRKFKGKMLEEWCFKEAFKRDLEPEKLILIDSRRSPTRRYFLMKEEIKSFLKTPIELDVELIVGDLRSYYREIDVIFRAEEFLFIIECKGTKVPLGEAGEYIKWTSNYDNVMDIINDKYKNLLFNIKNELIKHPLLNGIKNIIPMVVQTEGIFENTFIFTTHQYIHALNNLVEHKKAGTIDELFKAPN